MAPRDRLSALPVEMLHGVFRLLDPKDLASLMSVSPMLNDYVKENKKLYKDIYLSHYDTPNNMEQDWIKEVQDITKLSNICKRATEQQKALELDFAHDVVTRLLQNASSKGHTTDTSACHAASYNADLLRTLFQDATTVAAFLERSFLFERQRRHNSRFLKFPNPPNPSHAKSAKLHCLYGRPILNAGRLRSSSVYPFACSKVYDVRGYTRKSLWGPFVNDGSGRVDWELLEAIMLTIGFNIHSKKFVKKLFADIWDSPFSGSWPRSFLGAPRKEISDVEARDPYGITGTWYRVICFLDYNDFLAFNFARGLAVPPDMPRRPIPVGEATRLILMQVHVTEVHDPKPEDAVQMPVVHFEGISRMIDEGMEDTMHNHIHVSRVVGTVRTTEEGEVRWTTVSVFDGTPRWKSEGIQVGGINSGRGVFGSWGDNHRGQLEPVGPSAFWKASNDEQKDSSLEDMLPNGFLAYAALMEMDPDPEGDMEYTSADDEIDDDDELLDIETLEGELPALLLDAEMQMMEAIPGSDDEGEDEDDDEDGDGDQENTGADAVPEEGGEP